MVQSEQAVLEVQACCSYRGGWEGMVEVCLQRSVRRRKEKTECLVLDPHQSTQVGVASCPGSGFVSRHTRGCGTTPGPTVIPSLFVDAVVHGCKGHWAAHCMIVLFALCNTQSFAFVHGCKGHWAAHCMIVLFALCNTQSFAISTK